MGTMKYAFAMLAPCAVALAPAAHAVILQGSLTNPLDSYVETFDVSSTSGYVDQNDSGVFDFQVTNDSQGNNTLFFGDSFDSGIFGTGVNSGSGVSVSKLDFAFPEGAIYNDTPFTLTPGTTTGYFDTTLTLSAVPEPDAWALLVAGAALVGGAARASRRRRQSAMA